MSGHSEVLNFESLKLNPFDSSEETLTVIRSKFKLF